MSRGDRVQRLVVEAVVVVFAAAETIQLKAVHKDVLISKARGTIIAQARSMLMAIAISIRSQLETQKLNPVRNLEASTQHPKSQRWPAGISEVGPCCGDAGAHGTARGHDRF